MRYIGSIRRKRKRAFRSLIQRQYTIPRHPMINKGMPRFSGKKDKK